MTHPMRRRTHARELALQLLYQIDLRGDEVLADVDRFLAEATPHADVREYAGAIVRGTWKIKEELDTRLRTVTKNWDVRRMAAIDRNVLRLAIWELQHFEGVPPKVVINEAIELGKKFSTANSGGFVNGILDRIRKDLEAERLQAGVPKAPLPETTLPENTLPESAEQVAPAQEA